MSVQEARSIEASSTGEHDGPEVVASTSQRALLSKATQAISSPSGLHPELACRLARQKEKELLAVPLAPDSQSARVSRPTNILDPKLATRLQQQQEKVVVLGRRGSDTAPQEFTTVASTS